MEVDEITTLYPKEAKGIVNWINEGLAANIDKKKTLAWITALQSHPETAIDKQELLREKSKLTNKVTMTKSNEWHEPSLAGWPKLTERARKAQMENMEAFRIFCEQRPFSEEDEERVRRTAKTARRIQFAKKE